MHSFNNLNPNEIKENPFELIGNRWMLVTSGDEKNFNTMTASWGSLGIMWGKKVAFTFIRPQRYTFNFMEKNDFYTLSFYPEEYRKVLSFCGSNSGKDVDKVKETGLTPIFENGFTYFKEADLVLVCKKIYKQFIDPDCFLDKNIEKNYSNKDYHKMYVGEILKVLKK